MDKFKMGFEPMIFRRPHKEYRNQPVDAVVNGEVIHFKSKLEYRWANYLETLKRGGIIKDWSYETHTFKFDNIGVEKWKVDFVIRNINNTFEYHECKGHFEKRDLDKLKCLFEFRPEVQLTYIFGAKPKLTPNKIDWLNRVCQRVIFNGNTIVNRSPKYF